MWDQGRWMWWIMTAITVWTAAAPCGAQGHQAVPELSFWVVGSSGVPARFGPDLYPTLGADKPVVDRLLLALAEQPQPENQLRVRTGLDRAQLEATLARLAAVHVVARDGGGRWATTVPVMTDRQMMRLREVLTPLARAVARKIDAASAELIALYDRVKSPGDPPWESVSHLVIDKFLIDGAFHSAIVQGEEERGFRRYYSQTQQILPAFFFGQGEHFSTFGTNWYPFARNDSQRAVYVLHGSALRRQHIRMNAYRQDPVITQAIFAVGADGEIDSLSEEGKNGFRALGWIKGAQLLVPVVQARTIKALLPRVEEISRDAASVVLDDFSVMVDAFDSSPYARFLNGGGDYLQVCYHTLFGITIEQLMDVGVVPPLPDPVPEAFGVYIVFGKVY